MMISWRKNTSMVGLKKTVFMKLASALFLFGVVRAIAQAPAGPAAATQVGSPQQQTFAQNCGFCHGQDGRGGAEGGPDLRGSQVVTGDPTGARVVSLLKTGSENRRMPALDLPEAKVNDILAFLRALNAPVAGFGFGRGAIVAEVTGDPKAGEAYFNGVGRCNTCHSVTGDLKGAGTRMSASTLQGRLVYPRGNGSYPGGGAFVPLPGAKPDRPRQATVTLADGSSYTGDVLAISDFILTITDKSGTRRTFTRDGDVPKVVVTDPLQAHIDLMPKLTDKTMHDLTAYLVTLK
jgi:mono/diheme cytochrome c family protein